KLVTGVQTCALPISDATPSPQWGTEGRSRKGGMSVEERGERVALLRSERLRKCGKRRLEVRRAPRPDDDGGDTRLREQPAERERSEERRVGNEGSTG